MNSPCIWLQSALTQLRAELDAARDETRSYERAMHRLEARAAELSVREHAQEQAAERLAAENAQLRDALRSKLDLGSTSKVCHERHRNTLLQATYLKFCMPSNYNGPDSWAECQLDSAPRTCANQPCACAHCSLHDIAAKLCREASRLAACRGCECSAAWQSRLQWVQRWCGGAAVIRVAEWRHPGHHNRETRTSKAPFSTSKRSMPTELSEGDLRLVDRSDTVHFHSAIGVGSALM